MTTFPKTFLDNLRASISLSDLIGETVSWDQKKTKSSQGDFWGSCPFHEEKTASFHVDSNKGFYYCFGCQAKGDCFTFLKEHERLSFYESVTYLANKVGVPIPKQKDKKQSVFNAEAVLFKINEEATKFFVKQLTSSSGLHCRHYLKVRGISDAAEKHFEIGFASNSKNALYKHLEEKNFKKQDIINSGLCMISGEENSPFDRFRNRVMFPIKDLMNRTIAFGGRSLDTKAPAKYLNSPETPIFAKRHVVYNYFNSKSATKNSEPLILVEGYMDVIALFDAGLPNAVAPLGTAVTEIQLQQIWRLHSEPIVLFDGDKAGKNAAIRLLNLALPSLEPKKSMRFGNLPSDQDPDDFLKLEGRKGLLKLIKSAEPVIEILWNHLTYGQVFDSPERKAALDLKIQEYINKIKNTHLKNHFSQAMREMKRNFFFNPISKWPKKNNVRTGNIIEKTKRNSKNPLKETQNSLVGNATTNVNLELRLKEGIIILGCINHPAIAYTFENELSRLKFKFSDLEKIRDAILAELPIQSDTTRDAFLEKLEIRLKFNSLEKLKKIPQLMIHPYLGPRDTSRKASKAIRDAIIYHNSLTQFHTEIERAEDEFFVAPTEDITHRITEAKVKLNKAIKGSEPRILDTEELRKASSKRLDLMIKEKIWLKKK